MRLIFTLFAALIFTHVWAQRTSEIAKVDSIVQIFDKPNAPGFSIGIVENGQIIYAKGIGFSNIGQKAKNSGNSIFGVASIAKQFTAACIWNLIKEGKISLDDDLRKYIPEFPSYGESIRIRHMLNHTSGIRNYHAIMDLAGFDYDKEFHDNQTILKLACKQKGLNNIPGEKVLYGNTAYTLLAIIIERITGKNLNQYANEKLFAPLGMYNTFYRVDTTTYIPNRVMGYAQNDDGSYAHLKSNQISYGAGSVCSSIEDLAIWSNVLNGLNPAYLDLTDFLTTVENLPSGEKAKYARGVMVNDYKNIKTIHHSGYGLGSQSQIMAIPELKLSIIILTNTQSINPSPISYHILDLFVPQQNNETSKPSSIFHPKKQEMKHFVGQYKEQHSDMKMEIILENDTLKTLSGQGKKYVALTPTAESQFVRTNNPGVSYVFNQSKSTAPDLTVYFGGTPFYFLKAKFMDPKTINITDYVGLYSSDELQVEYEIYIKNDGLYVNYPNHAGTKLTPGQKDEFGNGQRMLYHFGRNRKNKVIKFYLSAEGTVKDIEFIKK